jgi:hypothetical protein
MEEAAQPLVPGRVLQVFRALLLALAVAVAAAAAVLAGAVGCLPSLLVQCGAAAHPLVPGRVLQVEAVFRVLLLALAVAVAAAAAVLAGAVVCLPCLLVQCGAAAHPLVLVTVLFLAVVLQAVLVVLAKVEAAAQPWVPAVHMLVVLALVVEAVI